MAANALEGMNTSGRPSLRTPCRMARIHSASLIGATPPFATSQIARVEFSHWPEIHRGPTEVLAWQSTHLLMAVTRCLACTIVPLSLLRSSVSALIT